MFRIFRSRCIVVAILLCKWWICGSFAPFRSLPQLLLRPSTHATKVSLDAELPIADEIDSWNADFYDIFVRDYLQQRPLLIRNAFPDIQEMLQLDTEDYFDLAADDDVNTRLFRKVSTPDGGVQTSKQFGPFPKAQLRAMPPADWSILVQEVDRHVPRVADLWGRGFDFIPSWRRDDVMISYSMPGGSIGGHVDNYDVFLLQGRCACAEPSLSLRMMMMLILMLLMLMLLLLLFLLLLVLLLLLLLMKVVMIMVILLLVPIELELLHVIV